ncbi:DUF1493 family protein [Paraburkholderia terrae]|jgi:hypothetical protein|uniref:DUF1493 family protein n=1 Tax=Paraburkholderia terrae TaxID=311230 RepID=UPI001EE19CD6|nr:DUF1493 family protein [Paraburkholderia terrae]GJH03731.1 DUF1493 family protein [Paraburkholderia terrae]
MTRQQEVSAELEAFIRKQVRLPAEKSINPADQLEDDYGVSGDDADDFMHEFGKRFHVRPGDFVLQRYFDMEGISGPLCFITRWLHKKMGIKKYRKEPLTIAMLQRSIDLGVWDSQRLDE